VPTTGNGPVVVGWRYREERQWGGSHRGAAGGFV
jgi:hypothetical protein